VVKLIVAIKRKQGMSPKDFHDHWGTQHATLVKSCPASRRYIRKYVQCHTLDEEYLAGEPAFDGTAELWFESVADKERSLIITGTGDVLEPEQGIVAIGSGGPFAQSAALALLQNTELAARDIVDKALAIAADLCIYTNHQRTIEVLE